MKRAISCVSNHSRTLTTAAQRFTGGNVAEASNLPPTYGGRHIVTMLPGVGSGPQMMKYVKDVFKVAYVPVDFEVIDYDQLQVGNGANEMAIEPVLSSIRRNCVGIKGHIPDISANLLLRSQLDLYVYFVHCRTYKNIKSRFPNLDIFVFRQNTQGEYGMLEHESRPGVVESLKIITKSNTERFAKWAFDFARRKCRNRITVVHKAKIMPLSEGLFLDTVLGVAKDYPDLKVEDIAVEKCCSQIISDPSNFDVILTPNLYGNIVTSVICGLIGGPGLISGQNYGDHSAVFEVASRHISFEDERSVNPVAMLNASMNMLYHLKLDKHADLIKDSIFKTLVEDRTQTADIGGSNTGPEVVENIKRNIKEGLKEHSVAIF